MKSLQRKYLMYGSAGIGGGLLLFVLWKALKKAGSATRLVGEASMVPLDFVPSAPIPALGMLRDVGTGVFREFELNYTPTSEGDSLSSQDYERLQAIGLIPEGFPQDSVVKLPSHNGRNTFVVGYSAPHSMRTNRDPIEVIEPVWAVSVDRNFDPSNVPPEGFADLGIFEDVARRTLFSEWLLTNRGEEGCHRDQSLSECNLERAAILNLIIQRTRMKQQKIDGSLSYDSVIFGPGIKWNGSDAFMSSFHEGGAGASDQRFESFYNSAFWAYPQFSGYATNFIHPFSMSSGGTNPSWIHTTAPAGDPSARLVSEYPIRLGNAVFTDRRQNFK